MMMILAIALGGAVGALARYALADRVNALVVPWMLGGPLSGMPVGILACNIVGSLIMGVLVEIFSQSALATAELKAFAMVGLLGAFTTFSTFSLETVTLLQRGDLLKAGFYMAASVLFSVLGLYLGMLAAKAMTS